jgi:hypothetical protein
MCTVLRSLGEDGKDGFDWTERTGACDDWSRLVGVSGNASATAKTPIAGSSQKSKEGGGVPAWGRSTLWP